MAMDGTKLQLEDKVSRIKPWVAILFAIIATEEVVEQVIAWWHSFDASQKSIALMLLATLVVFPPLAVWAEKKKGGGVDRLTMALISYICLSLVCRLFTHL
jgi:hypothetical protein